MACFSINCLGASTFGFWVLLILSPELLKTEADFLQERIIVIEFSWDLLSDILYVLRLLVKPKQGEGNNGGKEAEAFSRSTGGLH